MNAQGGCLAPPPPKQDFVHFFSSVDEHMGANWSATMVQTRKPLDLGQADALARALPETGETALIRCGEGYVVEREVPGVSKRELANYLSLARQFDVELNIDPEMRDDENVLLLEFAR